MPNRVFDHQLLLFIGINFLFIRIWYLLSVFFDVIFASTIGFDVIYLTYNRLFRMAECCQHKSTQTKTNYMCAYCYILSS